MGSESSDQDRAQFLRDLDDAADRIDVTSWEADFIGSCMDRTMFSPKQRDIIDRLRAKYGSRL